MATTAVLMSIAVIVMSVAIGLVLYYVWSRETKEQKRYQLGEIISQLINFVIFVWIAKILWHLPTFITDPIPILAYPSDSKAFYLACVGLVAVLLYKAWRKKFNVVAFGDAGSFVLLMASLMYAFIQLIWNHDTYQFGYLVLTTCLVIVYVSVHDRLPKEKWLLLLVTGWSVGMLLLSIWQPYISLFGYMLAPWFIIVVLLVSWFMIIWQNRKRGRNGRN